jgi:putative membrane protein
MLRIAIPATLLAAPAFADQGDYGHMMDWGFGVGFMFGPVLWLIVLGLIVAGLVWLVRRSDQGHGGTHGPNASGRDAHGNSDAVAALNMRFAKGEIDEEEYLARKKHLAG